MLGSRALSSAILALAVAANVSAQQAASHKVVPLRPMPSEQWINVLAGDPSKPGVPFVLRIHNDAGYVCAPHTHPTDENIVVVQGSWGVGMGSRIALPTVEPLEVGAYGLVPGKMAHYCLSKTETIIQVHGVGPFSVDLVDPSYVMTAAGAGVMGGSPVGSQSPVPRAFRAVSSFAWEIESGAHWEMARLWERSVSPAINSLSPGFKGRTANDFGRRSRI